MNNQARTEEVLSRAVGDINRREPQFPAPPPRVTPAPTGPAPVVDLGTRDHLTALHRMITEPMTVPRVGVMASQAMQNGYEAIAVELERLAQDHVDQALALQQEIQSFAAIIRESGSLLSDRIQRDAARGAQIDAVVRSTRQMLANPPANGDSKS